MSRLGALLLLSALASGSTTAAAETPNPRLPCSDYREVKRQLGAKYEEAPVSIGLQTNGNLLQVFASTRSGSWTIVSTSPSGKACIIAAGQRWESLPVVNTDPAA